VVIFTSVVTLGASPRPQANDSEYPVVGCGKARAALRTLAGPPLVDEEPEWVRQLRREAFDDTDVLHYDLDIEIDPTNQTVTGTNVMTIRSLVSGLTEFTFRLRSNYTITSALINGSTPVSITNVSTTTRAATLDRPYDPNEVFTLTIAYTGVAISRGFGSIEFTTQGGQPLVYTLSEPYYAYTWWPCKDGDVGEPGDNADKATIDIAVTAPDTMRTVSNGVLVGVDALPGNRRRYRWSTTYPIATYLVCFASTNYNTWTLTYDYGSGTMPVEFNIFPAHDTSAHRVAWQQCVTMLETYEPLFGLYPFVSEKYGIYEFGFAGGMEHQTNTGQGGFWEYVTAHELAHQWWGDAVTCRTWHDIWLNEGFATYSEALWFEHKPGSSGLPALFSAMAARRPSEVSDSVYVYDPANLGRIFSWNFTYLKGAWVLHQLRHVVGDATFFDILATYRATFEGSAATTNDFAAVASSVAGQDLSWLFDEWVYGMGAPTYEYGWQSETINGQAYLRLYLQQVQTGWYGVFTMPVDVRVDTAGGSETVTVWNDEWAEHFVVPISDVATNIVLDEFDWILNEGKTSVGYVAGPPVVVQTSPPPGAQFDETQAPAQVSITFSEDVSVSPTDFSLVGNTSGSITFTLSYTSADYTATLDFGGPLAPDQYTLTVADSVVSAAAGIALDGEVADAADPASLPSGEGLPGGVAVITFVVVPACPGDLDGDNDVDLDDLTAMLWNFGMTGASPSDGDLDGDSDVDLNDLTLLLQYFAATCS